jgi:hypothetical protein
MNQVASRAPTSVFFLMSFRIFMPSEQVILGRMIWGSVWKILPLIAPSLTASYVSNRNMLRKCCVHPQWVTTGKVLLKQCCSTLGKSIISGMWRRVVMKTRHFVPEENILPTPHCQNLKPHVIHLYGGGTHLKSEETSAVRLYKWGFPQACLLPWRGYVIIFEGTTRLPSFSGGDRSNPSRGKSILTEWIWGSQGRDYEV